MSEATDTIEANLLSCAYLDGEVIDRAIAAGIKSECFCGTNLGEHWRFLCSLRLAGKSTEFESVFSEAIAAGSLDALGGPERLMYVSGCQPTSAHAASYITTVLDTHAKRQGWKVGTQLVESLVSGQATVEDIGKAAEKLTAIATGQQPVHRSIDDIDAEVEAKVKAAQGPAPDESQLIRWGIPKVDRFMLSIEKHEYVLICARPSRGKSSLLCHLAGTNIARKMTVAFFTLETSDTAVFMQIAAQRCALNLKFMREWSPGDFKRFNDTRTYLRTSKKLLIFDRDMSLEAITSRCRLLAASKNPPRLVVIDYLGLVNTKGKDIYERVSTVSKAMIPLRKMLGCPLVAGQQLKRTENDAKEPGLSDLRDSGQLEEDASRAVFPHWRESHHLDQEHRPYVFLQPKFRDGPTTAVDGLMFHAPTTRFMETAV